jgi:predicted HicB family RNase H-like nuclease
MNYKGYIGVVKFDSDAGVLRGQVADLRDVITFQGQTVAEVVQAFHDSVDDYLEFCAERGENPERPFSGKLLVRLKPDVHRALTATAMDRGVSVNRLVSGQLTKLARLSSGSGLFRIASEPKKAHPASKVKKSQAASKGKKAGGKAGKSSVDSGNMAST